MSRRGRVRTANGLAAILALSLVVACSFFPAEEQPIARDANYGWIREEEIVVSATGTEGAASGSETGDPVRGHLYALHLDYTSGISTTTDLTITLSSPPLTVLDLSNYYTDTWLYPAVQQTGSDGAGLSVYDRLPVIGRLTAAVAQSTVTNVVTVTIWYGE